MIDEPIYIDAGDEFDMEDHSWKYPDDLKNQIIIKQVFYICGKRKYFKSKKEARKWRKIDGQIDRGVLPSGWVKNCIDWAKDKNEQLCAIKVDALGSLILNKARMQDWQMEHKRDARKPNDHL